MWPRKPNSLRCVALSPTCGFGGAKPVILDHGIHLVLPRDVLALDVLFKFNGAKSRGLEFIGVLDGHGHPAQRSAGSISAFARDQGEVPCDDEWVDEAQATNRVCQDVDVT